MKRPRKSKNRVETHRTGTVIQKIAQNSSKIPQTIIQKGDRRPTIFRLRFLIML
ncbi:MAG: hypothetical protein KFF72_03190 [Arthrospira sp. SH-MAG29]|nr:hypothetical protein [Arthrospira sp. SH-MAG29]MBS0015370.1 hypothetical protein [Arthrospira sp. SH-MAG29]